ncbi:MAG: histidine phosphatase family protein, partial [Patescibacteria group bacterium]
MQHLTHIYLVRHAQKRSDFGDPGLTALGLKQAQITATYFAKIGIDTICSSPLLRTRETVVFIARETNCELEIDERITERANWGDLKGQTFPEFELMWERATKDRDWHPPIGDSSRHAGMR